MLFVKFIYGIQNIVIILLTTIFSFRIFLSAFFFPHFPVRIRIRHRQVSGPRFTDNRVKRGRLQ